MIRSLHYVLALSSAVAAIGIWLVVRSTRHLRVEAPRMGLVGRQRFKPIWVLYKEYTDAGARLYQAGVVLMVAATIGFVTFFYLDHHAGGR